MREVHCPQCNATNRRLKCGSCQKEIADPPAIEVRLEAPWASQVSQICRNRLYDRSTGARFVAPVGDVLFLLSNQCCRIQRTSSPDCQIERRCACLLG